MSENVSRSEFKLYPPQSGSIGPAAEKEGKPAVPVVAESKSEGRTWSWGDVKKGAKYGAYGAGGLAVLYYGGSPLWQTVTKVPGVVQTFYNVFTDVIPEAIHSFSRGVNLVQQMGSSRHGNQLVLNSWFFGGVLDLAKKAADPLLVIIKPLWKESEVVASATATGALVGYTYLPETFDEHPIATTLTMSTAYFALSHLVGKVATYALPLFAGWTARVKTRLGFPAPAPAPAAPLVPQIVISPELATALMEALQKVARPPAG